MSKESRALLRVNLTGKPIVVLIRLLNLLDPKTQRPFEELK
jgi:hypothetical protein